MYKMYYIDCFLWRGILVFYRQTMTDQKIIIRSCKRLLDAYSSGKLGDTTMPEDTHPDFANLPKEAKLVYFTLPMSLNYQRDSFTLWKSVLKTFYDPETAIVFDIETSANLAEDRLRSLLLKHKVALQPNKHIATWQRISKTIYEHWGSIENLFSAVDYDFLKLKEIMQTSHKKGFPYISGPKIFNYWSLIIQQYGGLHLKNSNYIDIAPDTHITKCSVRLGVISQKEAETLSKDNISRIWKELLEGSGINPIDMHPPLWFWSKNNFTFTLD